MPRKTTAKKSGSRGFKFGSIKEAILTVSSILGVIAVGLTVWYGLEKHFTPVYRTELNEMKAGEIGKRIDKVEERITKGEERMDFKIWLDREEENQKRIWEIMAKYPPGSKEIPELIRQELNQRLVKKDKIAKILKYYEDKGFKLEGD